MSAATTATSENAFHQGYDDACAQAEATGPVFAVLADALVVFRGRQRHERHFALEGFHAIKVAAHMPIAAFAVAYPRLGLPLDPAARASLASLRSAGRPPTGGVEDPRAMGDMSEATDMTLAYADELLRAEVVVPASLRDFALRAGPVLVRLTEHATRVQLAALHEVVEEEISALSDKELRVLQVVVAGDHQARVRSLGMQYFEKRFGESPGREGRVTYGEGIQNAEEALVLIGKRRVDRAIATAFFGDGERLQRDVLGDAAATLLRDFAARPIPMPRL